MPGFDRKNQDKFDVEVHLSTFSSNTVDWIWDKLVKEISN